MNVLACGALANELMALKKLNHWPDDGHNRLNVTCLSASYHLTPQQIPAAVKAAIEKIRSQNDDEILVAYGDCGTGGLLDKVLDEAGVERLPGDHCYAFFTGCEAFHQLHEAEIGTFYLTDFLTRYFETYVWRALGLDRKPELMDMYFGNYKKLVYLAQTESTALQTKAQASAERLGLAYQYQFTGYGEMGSVLGRLMPGVVHNVRSSDSSSISIVAQAAPTG